MIRFVDLTEYYWTSPDDHAPPCCAFLNTVDDRFLENGTGSHTFDTPEDLDELDEFYRDRCKALVPVGFWQRRGRTAY